MSPTTVHAMTQEMQECIDNCLNCHAMCVHTTTHCLEMGGKHAAPEHIIVLQDCAQICGTCADFMLRGSERHARTCAVCAEVCRACADSCERLAGDDDVLRQCAELCRECAESCQRMAA
jgi:hypothetical protein